MGALFQIFVSNNLFGGFVGRLGGRLGALGHGCFRGLSEDNTSLHRPFGRSHLQLRGHLYSPQQRDRLGNFMSRGAADQGGACFGVAVYLPQRLAPELAGSLDLRPGTIPDSADLLKIYQVSQGF